MARKKVRKRGYFAKYIVPALIIGIIPIIVSNFSEIRDGIGNLLRVNNSPASVRRYIQRYLPSDGFRFGEVDARRSGNILAEIYTDMVIRISSDIVDDMVWYDGVTTFSRANGNAGHDGNYIVAGDATPYERKIAIWIRRDAYNQRR